MKTISLFLLFTLGSLQNYGPYARPWRGGDHSLAAAHGNVLLAFSETDASGRARVRVVMLDSAGRGISPIHTLPALTESRDALVPAVATDGESFLVVWEEALGVQHTVAMALDRDGAPVGEPHPLTNDAPILSSAYEPSRARWTGSEYVVINGAGAQIGVNREAQSLGAAGANSLVTVGIRKVRAGNIGFPGTGAIRYWTYIDWRVGEQSLGATNLGVDVDISAPVIARAGNRYVIVWTGNNGIWMRYTDESFNRSYEADADTFSRPRLECGSTRCFVAYATKHNDIAGYVFDHRQPAILPTPFTAAASSATEREPALAVISDTRALITWRSTDTDGEHLLGRPLTFPTKQRAVR